MISAYGIRDGHTMRAHSELSKRSVVGAPRQRHHRPGSSVGNTSDRLAPRAELYLDAGTTEVPQGAGATGGGDVCVREVIPGANEHTVMVVEPRGQVAARAGKQCSEPTTRQKEDTVTAGEAMQLEL